MADEAEEEDKDEDYQEESFNYQNMEVSKKSLIKVKKVHQTTYFQKGKLNEIGNSIKKNLDIEVVFINTSLSQVQRKKLERFACFIRSSNL